MKLNNRGFAISTLMYMILILAVILILATLSILSTRKLVLDKLKKDVSDKINERNEVVIDTSKLICTFVDSNTNKKLDVAEVITCTDDTIDFEESYYAIDVSSNKSVKVLTKNNIDKINKIYGQKEDAATYNYPTNSIASNEIVGGYLKYLKDIGLVNSKETIDFITRKELYTFLNYHTFSNDYFWIKNEGEGVCGSEPCGGYDDNDKLGYRPVFNLDLSRWGIKVNNGDSGSSGDSGDNPSVSPDITLTFEPDTVDICVSDVETGLGYGPTEDYDTSRLIFSGVAPDNISFGPELGKTDCSDYGVSISSSYNSDLNVFEIGVSATASSVSSTNGSSCTLVATAGNKSATLTVGITISSACEVH